MRKFPSIEQFRHVVEDVTHRATYTGQDENDNPIYDLDRPKPTLTFNGYVKLHGSNCGLSFIAPDNAVETQSRERILTTEDDNFGFCAFIESRDSETMKHLRMALQMAASKHLAVIFEPDSILYTERISVFGEWCGPSINGKTGIGKLSNRWVVLGAVVILSDESEVWLPIEEMAKSWHDLATMYIDLETQIFFISDFKKYSISIDFNRPEESLEELERLTLEVETSCPVAVAMGGDGIGEGIVWSLRDPKYGHLVFKTKGLKHKGTKNRRMVDIAPEVLESQAAFVTAVVTESRLEQGYDFIRAKYGKVYVDHVGEFLQWFGGDVLKEESDTLKASGLDRKQVMGSVNKMARAWLIPRLDKC